MNQPLEGIRIIDFSHMQAGPFCTMIMAAMGAEVIKIESMQHIDPYRRASLEGVDMSYSFNEFNLGKKSVRLNLQQPRAVELAKRLVAEPRLLGPVRVAHEAREALPHVI